MMSKIMKNPIIVFPILCPVMEPSHSRFDLPAGKT